MNKGTTSKLPLGKGVTLLAEHACGLLAFFKPAGVLSHPNTDTDISRALLKAKYDHANECYDVGQPGTVSGHVWLLNRLDSATSGVLLCATRESVANVVRQQFADNRVRKKYFALVFGTLAPPRQVWRDRLRVSREEGHVRTTAREGVAAETEVKLAQVYPGRYPVSLVELYPKTGRTHQLRVQCAKRKLPIVGDQTYGQFSWNREFAKATRRKRLFLHSAEVALNFKLAGETVRFSARAPVPKEFTP